MFSFSTAERNNYVQLYLYIKIHTLYYTHVHLFLTNQKCDSIQTRSEKGKQLITKDHTIG